VDLHFLSELTETPGPYATVYLDASHDSVGADRELELRWAGSRSELAEQGADEPTLVALDRVVADADPAVGRAGRVLVAAGGRVLFDRDLPEPPARTTATWGPSPDLLPLLLDAPPAVTAVVVRVDRSGGEIMLAGPGDRPEKVDDVTGTSENLHKVKAGGFGDWSVQRRVEQNWRDNIAEVAAHRGDPDRRAPAGAGRRGPGAFAPARRAGGAGRRHRRRRRAQWRTLRRGGRRARGRRLRRGP
jgi:hypothetical protein